MKRYGREGVRHVLVLDDLLKEVCKALLEADVNVRLVQTLRKNVKDAVNIKEQPAGINKKRLIQNVCALTGSMER